jgi:hypothetical protein
MAITAKVVLGLLAEKNKVVFKNIKVVQDRCTDGKARTRFTDLITAYVGLSRDRGVQIEAGTVVRYKLHNPGAVLESLMENETYKSQIHLWSGKQNEQPMTPIASPNKAQNKYKKRQHVRCFWQDFEQIPPCVNRSLMNKNM